MKLFTVGPVEMYPETLKIEGTQLPYFRTAEFGDMMKESAKMFLSSLNAPEGSGFIGLTCSGTGAMDAAVVNTLGRNDKALVINGGSFGARFAQICRRYGIDTVTYDIPYMEAFDKAYFEKEYSGQGYTALLVNACETSTGQLYDLSFLGDFCKKNDLFFVVDAVSAYLADPIDMSACGIDVLLTASQKALSLSPGAAYVALSDRAVKRVMKEEEDGSEENADGSEAAKYGNVSTDGSEAGSKNLADTLRIPIYFDFKEYLINQRRGQPPYTSAVGIMLAFYDRMKHITEKGINEENRMHQERAEHFRSLIRNAEDLKLEIPDIPLSNCVTPVVFTENNATKAFNYLKDNCGMILTPSGGDWKDRQLRVGHLGNLELSDYDRLVEALREALRDA